MNSANRVRKASRTSNPALFFHEPWERVKKGSFDHLNWLRDNNSEKRQSLGPYNWPDQKSSCSERILANQGFLVILHSLRQRLDICDVWGRRHLHAMRQGFDDSRGWRQLQNLGNFRCNLSTVSYRLEQGMTSLALRAGVLICLETYSLPFSVCLKQWWRAKCSQLTSGMWKWSYVKMERSTRSEKEGKK